MKTLILGLGNDLLADEGIGVHAVRRLQHELGERPELAILDGGTLSFTLAGPIAEADRLIVIDATQLNAAPGTVRLFRDQAMDEFLHTGKRKSVHEVGLIDLMAIARLTDALPGQRALIGVQPEKVEWGDAPTPAVAEALHEVCRLTRDLLEGWSHGVR